MVRTIAALDSLVRKIHRAIFGYDSVGSLHKALRCLARPLLFLATFLVFLIVLFWFPSKMLIVVLFLLFLVLIGLI